MKFSDVESDASKYGISIRGYTYAHSLVKMYKEAEVELKGYIYEMEMHLDKIKRDYTTPLASYPESAEGKFKDMFDQAVEVFDDKITYVRRRLNMEYVSCLENRNKALQLQGYWEDKEQSELTSIANSINAKKEEEERARIAAEQARADFRTKVHPNLQLKRGGPFL